MINIFVGLFCSSIVKEAILKSCVSTKKVIPNPATFISMNDGDFAKDDTYVFNGKTPLPKANPATWRKISHFYSKDDKRIYYLNKLIKEADYDTFEVVVLTSPEGYKLPYGKDKNQYYNYGNPLSEAEALHEVNKPIWDD